MPTRKNNSRRIKKFSNKRKMNKRSSKNKNNRKKNKNKNKNKSIKRKNMRGGEQIICLYEDPVRRKCGKSIKSSGKYYENFVLMNHLLTTELAEALFRDLSFLRNSILDDIYNARNSTKKLTVWRIATELRGVGAVPVPGILEINNAIGETWTWQPIWPLRNCMFICKGELDQPLIHGTVCADEKLIVIQEFVSNLHENNAVNSLINIKSFLLELGGCPFDDQNTKNWGDNFFPYNKTLFRNQENLLLRKNERKNEFNYTKLKQQYNCLVDKDKNRDIVLLLFFINTVLHYCHFFRIGSAGAAGEDYLTTSMV